MDVRRFLHREQVAVAAAQQRLVDFLRSKKISIGSEPSAPTESKLSPEESFFKERLAVSTKDNPIECRVTLDTAPEGTICVAPCGCSGSQKWIQLSVLNKLRRKDPAKWTICQTCRQPYELSYISAHCDIKASLLGSILDHPATIRLAIAAFAIAVGYLVSLPALAMKFIVSQVFWQAVRRFHLFFYTRYLCLFAFLSMSVRTISFLSAFRASSDAEHYL